MSVSFHSEISFQLQCRKAAKIEWTSGQTSEHQEAANLPQVAVGKPTNPCLPQDAKPTLISMETQPEGSGSELPIAPEEGVSTGMEAGGWSGRCCREQQDL